MTGKKRLGGHANRQVLPIQAEYIRESRIVANRRQRALLIGVSLALLVSIVAGFFAVVNSIEANRQKVRAEESALIAKANEAKAIANEQIAATQKAIAEKNETEAKDAANLANANYSAAQSQNYQTRGGALDTSTLLAIDSYRRHESFQAEDLIRSNSTQLAIPVKQMSQDGLIWNIEWTPDYKYFVTGNKQGLADQNAVSEACVWRASDGEKLYCVQHENDVNDAIFTRDGKYLITASADRSVRFWNAQTGELVKSLHFGGAVLDMDVSDSILAIGREDNLLTLYYLNSPDLKTVDHEEDSGVYVVKFSPNGALLAIGLTNGNVKFWQANNNFFYNGPKHPKSNYVVLAFSPDSSWLVSGGGDSIARLTKRDGTVQYVVPHGDWVEDIAFGPDPSWYVTVSDDNKVRVLDTITGKEKLRMSHANFAQRVEVSPDGQWIASTGHDHVVRIWDSASGSQMLEFPLKANGSAIAFNQDGTRIVATDENGDISIWDISTLATRLGYIEFPEFVHEARLTPSGEYLVVNTDDYNIWRIPLEDINQIKDGTKGRIIFSAKSLTYDTAISPDSKWVAAVEYDSGNAQNDRGILVSINGQTQFSLPHGGEVTGIAFDKDSKYVATSGINGQVSFWDVQSGEKQQFGLNNSEAVYSLAISPVDTLAASGLHDKTRIWDTATFKEVTDLSQRGDIIAVVFSQDGKWLATGSTEGSVILWQVDGNSLTQMGKALRLNGKPQILAFSPDDRWLAGGGSSGFAYLWDTATVQEMARIPHSDPVTSVSFSLDGSQLFTVSRKVVRIWNVSAIPLVPKDELIASACSHLISNLSNNDWKILFGEEEYHLICPTLPEGK